MIRAERKDWSQVARHPEQIEGPAEHGGERQFSVQWFLRSGHPVQTVNGWVLDISVAGMMVRVPASYEIRALVEFEVFMSMRHQLRIIGEVVRRFHCRHGFYYGIAFRQFTLGDKKRLADELLRIRRSQYLQGVANNVVS